MSPAALNRVSRTNPRSASVRRNRLGRCVGKLIPVPLRRCTACASGQDALLTPPPPPPASYLPPLRSSALLRRSGPAPLLALSQPSMFFLAWLPIVLGQATP